MVRFYSSSIRMLLLTGFGMLIAPNLSSAQNNWVPDTVGLSQNISSLAINLKGDIFAAAQYPSSGGGYDPTGVFISSDSGKSSSQCPNPTFDQDIVPLGPIWGSIRNKKFLSKQSYEKHSRLIMAALGSSSKSIQTINMTPR